jgi:hypothetical protein
MDMDLEQEIIKNVNSVEFCVLVRQVCSALPISAGCNPA